MNNKNKILVGCLSLLLVLSVGYALFSDTITINGTATAKGDFNITPVCTMGPAPGTEDYFESLGVKEGGYDNVSCIADDSTDTITASGNFLYPRANRLFTVKFTNTGTIDATFPYSLTIDSGVQQLELSFKEGVSKICSALDVNADAETEGDCYEPKEGMELVGFAVQVGDGTIHFLEDFNEFPQDIMLAFTGNNGPVLKPGNSLYYYFVLGAPNMEGNVLNYYFNTSTTANFTQASN